ncbi:DUF998 domain-containing protein [Microbacterium sp. SLBN-146]|uniref:DUF998 domain-containing protein n=1 Tax=Microbacterium sp. SLBN-146 TaxID=2768457 RepID=UPI0021B27480|nr:DUF998 domain-containing protein [Microbacterium sp. SLBN-146]
MPLAIIAIAGVVLAVVALVIAHLRGTGLSPLRDPVSAYGISEAAPLYRLQTIGTAVAASALAAAVALSDLSSSLPAILALSVLAIARALISWVPMDAAGSPRTATGRAHNLLAFGAFAAASVGGFMVGIAFENSPGLEAFGATTASLGWIMTIASALTIASAIIATLRPIFGLAERLIYGGMLTWLAVTAAAFLTL